MGRSTGRRRENELRFYDIKNYFEVQICILPVQHEALIHFHLLLFLILFWAAIEVSGMESSGTENRGIKIMGSNPLWAHYCNMRKQKHSVSDKWRYKTEHYGERKAMVIVFLKVPSTSFGDSIIFGYTVLFLFSLVSSPATPSSAKSSTCFLKRAR